MAPLVAEEEQDLIATLDLRILLKKPKIASLLLNLQPLQPRGNGAYFMINQ